MRRYAIVVFCWLGLLSIANFAARSIVYGTGERDLLAEMVEAQRASRGLYMGLIHSPADYKLEMYKRSPADVVVIGSSRAMRLTQAFFSVPIYNFGGLVYSSGQAIGLMRAISAIHRPRLMIYMVDFWTFCALPGSDPDVAPVIPTRVVAPHWSEQVNQMRLVADLIARGHLSLNQAARLMVSHDTPTLDGVSLFGMTAAAHNYGFATDGALFTVRQVPNGIPDAAGRPEWFEGETYHRITNGIGQFPIGCRPYRAAMEQLRQMLDEAKSAGMELVLVTPPVAGLAVDAMASQGRTNIDYVEVWLGALASLPAERVMIAHDARSLGSDDWEFEDGIHGGFVTLARLLDRMASRLDLIREVVNPQALALTIERHSGQARLGLQEIRAVAAMGSGPVEGP